MRAEFQTTGGHELVTEFVARVNRAADGRPAREAYREAFARLRAQFELYPASGEAPSAVFESATATARALAASCLPLGVAVVMHLYPLCVLQCIPLPLLSSARFQRAMLLRTIRKRSLILANAGSERTRSAGDSVVARQDAHGIRIHGTFEYMSLASVADVALFKARLDDDSTVLCAADLRASSVRIGDWKFSGSMRLSDTAPVTFDDHLIPHGRSMTIAGREEVSCASEYQRCWFHLFLADAYLARLERLHDGWGLRRSAEAIVSLNELSQLREYGLRLLDEHSWSDLERLKKTTSAMKLRVSLMAQSTQAALRSRQRVAPRHARQLEEDASELGYIKSQPTADATILRGIGVRQAL